MTFVTRWTIAILGSSEALSMLTFLKHPSVRPQETA